MPEPVVDVKKCIGCGTCADICPIGVFVLVNSKSVVKKPKECIGCRACEVQCPQSAIKVKD